MDWELNSRIRMNNDSFFLTDKEHYIIDLNIDEIQNPYELEHTLDSIPGVVEHGLFINMADVMIVGNEDGVEIFSKEI